MRLKSAKRSGRKRGSRILPVIAATITALAIGGAIPAAAAPNTVHTVDGAGNARFAEYGDHIYLCDEKEDGHSVAVYVDYYHEDGYYKTDWRWNWWGPYKHGGCKDINLRVAENTTIGYYVCLGDHGHPGGKPANVIESSCSYMKFVYNDS